MITEEFLQFLWQYKLYSPLNLMTADGESVEIIHPGSCNHHAGPDFFNAKIKIGSTLWAGNVEIHHKASEWNSHMHHANPAYNNVILHVVIDNDCQIFTENGRQVPVLVMQIHHQLKGRYFELMQNQHWLSCSGNQLPLSGVEQLGWLEALLVGRLQERCEKIDQLHVLFNRDWDQVFFVMLSRAFGFGINNDAFEAMARLTPVKRLLQHADNLFQLEALLFGQAGLLEHPVDDAYHQQLATEYRFLQEKYALVPIESFRWKFLRLRPKNFPTIRLAQLAMFIHRHPELTGAISGLQTSESLKSCVDISASDHWLTRFVFGKMEASSSKHMGIASQNLLLINAILPFLFAYGRHRDDQILQDKALELMASLPPERNHITREWEIQGGIVADNAARSQALVYQYNQYCVPRKCLQCKIGLNYLQKAIF